MTLRHINVTSYLMSLTLCHTCDFLSHKMTLSHNHDFISHSHDFLLPNFEMLITQNDLITMTSLKDLY